MAGNATVMLVRPENSSTLAVAMATMMVRLSTPEILIIPPILSAWAPHHFSDDPPD
ncbi:hypothetical protein [Streptomyces wuyuanensis]|uniref:hypothetical protein n=1 Tax=Streptomyces wuyuanensis TaxID=1196353 RepID=UPI00341B7468